LDQNQYLSTLSANIFSRVSKEIDRSEWALLGGERLPITAASKHPARAERLPITASIQHRLQASASVDLK
jgi:hypothetical protein